MAHLEAARNAGADNTLLLADKHDWQTDALKDTASYNLVSAGTAVEQMPSSPAPFPRGDAKV